MGLLDELKKGAVKAVIEGEKLVKEANDAYKAEKAKQEKEADRKAEIEKLKGIVEELKKVDIKKVIKK